MDAYLWVLLAGALVSAALFAWRLERAGMKKRQRCGRCHCAS